jgi:chemotaxis protein histidine kinase CheA
LLQNQEFIQEFVEEARIHIEQVESDLLELAGSGEDQKERKHTRHSCQRDTHQRPGCSYHREQISRLCGYRPRASSGFRLDP